MKKTQLAQCALLALAMMVAGCGGGGGGTASGQAGAQPSGATSTLAGTASKGLMANAAVTLFAAAADGTLGATPIASTVTDASGRYTLNFVPAPSQVYVVKVTAVAGTTHLDEVTGQPQALPAGFALRSLLVTSDTGAVITHASVTPFSEMAVAAAERAAGGLTVANATKAMSTVAQLLSFDPTTVEVQPAASADSPDEQKLASLLAGVSQMAANGALGCNAADAGARVQCVVQGLADATTTSSLKLGAASSSQVAQQLAAALAAVLEEPRLAGQVPPSVLTNVLTNLECADTACAPATRAAPVAGTGTAPLAMAKATAVTASVATGIADAKALFGNIRADLAALFDEGSSSIAGSSEFDAQAHKFHDAMHGVQAPVELVVKDASAVLMGIDLYNDFKAGRTTNPNDQGGLGAVSDAGLPPFVQPYAVACSLYEDSAATRLATTPATANVIGCSARFHLAWVSNGAGTYSTRTWRHRFVLTPTATPGAFNYSVRANVVAFGVSTPLDPDRDFTGSVTTTLSNQGQILSFAVQGRLPGAFDMGGTTLVNHSHAWSVQASRSDATSDSALVTLAGTIQAFDESRTELSSLRIKTGTLTQARVSRTSSGAIVAPTHPDAVSPAGRQFATADLDLTWTTPGAQFQGQFQALKAKWSRSLTLLAPTEFLLKGRLSTFDGADRTDFLTARLSAKVGGLESYSEQEPTSATNFVTANLSLAGTATAPNRPDLQFSLGATQKSFESKPSVATLQYRSLLAGTPRTSLTLSVSRKSSGVVIATFREAVSGLSLKIRKGAATADLVLNDTTVIGTLDLDSGILTFVDGTFMSVDNV